MIIVMIILVEKKKFKLLENLAFFSNFCYYLFCFFITICILCRPTNQPTDQLTGQLTDRLTDHPKKVYKRLLF